MSREDFINVVVRSKALELRDVPGKVTNEEVEYLLLDKQPFLYASGNWGPGYVSIKGLVSKKSLFRELVQGLHIQLNLGGVDKDIDFVAGNATGGMIPGWLLSELLNVPYVYVRESRKKGGQKEVVTGAKYLEESSRGIVVEELVNFAESICNSAYYLRELGFKCNYGACILSYDNPEALKRLEKENIRLVKLFTLSELLDSAERFYDKKLVDEYRGFLEDPLKWQELRGLTKVEKGGTL